MKPWERRLKTWEDAGVVDPQTAARIRAFESGREHRWDSRWSAVVAWMLGGILLGAGVLLFVAAHWDRLSPSDRFTLVVLMVVAFHVAGALVRARDDTLG